MTRLMHRTISILIATVLFAVISGSGFYLGLHSFVVFLLFIPFLLVPLFQFIKTPMKCDQADCDGIAKLEIGPRHSSKWYGLGLYLSRGHICVKCGHLYKLPTGTRSTAVRLD